MQGEYYGKLLGSFTTQEHGVSGTLYAVDQETLLILNFRYDGGGPGKSLYWTTYSRDSLTWTDLTNLDRTH